MFRAAGPALIVVCAFAAWRVRRAHTTSYVGTRMRRPPPLCQCSSFMSFTRAIIARLSPRRAKGARTERSWMR